ncbi:CAP-associated domain-containing protein [Paenisporosarcina sp. TG20]|uniref:CAP domain-containing protein n=1 Tax=Paenisporosarcina sp. TG20 TaxID=1211706 RepID=UPI0002DB4011|nr:CAP-associated domain-containing protein [Paenisporosarcina sp. TG20]
MRYIKTILTILFAAYLSSPLWEEPAKDYVDVSFLDAIDAQVIKGYEFLKGQPFIENTITDISNAVASIPAKLTKSVSEPDYEPVNQVDKPTLATPTDGLFSVHNIQIGDKMETVSEELGKAKRTTTNEYGSEWHTFHTDYQNFMMVSFDESARVNGLFTNNDLIASSYGVKLNSSKTEVQEALGDPIKQIKKGNINYIMNDDGEMDTFLIENVYVTVFYDVHENNTVTAFQIISDSLEDQKPALYGETSEALQQGFEFQLFDLTNAARVHHKVPPVRWESTIRGTAYKHSLEMADKNYFSHTNLSGQSPFDRMSVDGIDYSVAGENLAYGQSSSIFAHEGLMNSIGHRKVLLKSDFTLLGVGVAFNNENQPYYTENFYTP